MTKKHGREVTLRSTIAIDHPADLVADVVLDWGRDDLWRPGVRALVCTPAGRAHPGQRLREEVGFAGLTFVTENVIGSAGARSATFAGGSDTVLSSGSRVVAPAGSGCVVHLTTRIRLAGWLRFLTPVLAPGYRRAQDADLRRLRWLVGTLNGPGAQQEVSA